MESSKAYHYKECGLDNVYLYNVPEIKDCEDKEVVYIPKINKLHKLIAMALIKKTGLLNNKEIRFLRTYIGLKQSEFAEKLGKESQAVGRWERGDNNQDATADILIRLLIADMMGLTKDMKYSEISELSTKEYSPVNDNINIDGQNSSDYMLMAA